MMATLNCQTLRLASSDLTVDLQVARRLSPALARRYHALPIAEDQGCVTVAMANPDDAMARQAVSLALNAPACVVSSDLEKIDALLAEIWPEISSRPHLLVCAPNESLPGDVLGLACSLGDLLDACVSRYCLAAGDRENCEAFLHQVELRGYDLVIWGEAEQLMVERLLWGPVYRRVIDKVPTSLLIAKQPQQQLKRLLLVVQGRDIDDAAVDWSIRLARPSGAIVTVLAVVPPMPAMYNQITRSQQGLTALLGTDTALGRQMHRVAHWLVDWGVESKLRLRQGTVSREICRELSERDYDLVIIAADPDNRWQRWLLGETVKGLLPKVDHSVLVAKSKV